MVTLKQPPRTQNNTFFKNSKKAFLNIDLPVISFRIQKFELEPFLIIFQNKQKHHVGIKFCIQTTIFYRKRLFYSFILKITAF